jgi:hypothetical protein
VTIDSRRLSWEELITLRTKTSTGFAIPIFPNLGCSQKSCAKVNLTSDPLNVTTFSGSRSATQTPESASPQVLRDVSTDCQRISVSSPRLGGHVTLDSRESAGLFKGDVIGFSGVNHDRVTEMLALCRDLVGSGPKRVKSLPPPAHLLLDR